jgi:hypothetical protein
MTYVHVYSFCLLPWGILYRAAKRWMVIGRGKTRMVAKDLGVAAGAGFLWILFCLGVMWFMGRYNPLRNPAPPLIVVAGWTASGLPYAVVFFCRSFGLPPGRPRSRFLPWEMFTLLGAILPWIYSGSSRVVLTQIIISVSYLLLVGVAIWRTALTAFKVTICLHQSPHARLTRLTAQNPETMFMHATDVHITRDRRTKTAEGCHSGDQLFAKFLHLALTLRPTYLFLTGDLTDSGHPKEWNIARATISNFQRHCKDTRIYLAPGDHDLSGSHGTSIVDFVYRRGAFWRYLRQLVRCNPNLTTCDGHLVVEALRSAIHPPKDKIQQTYLEIRTESQLIKKQAHWAYPAYDEFLALQRRFALQGAQADGTCNGDPYSLFPMFEHVPIRSSFVCILYSMVPSSTIGGSALGMLGDAQLDRLETLLASINELTKHLFVLMHHVPFRWWDEMFKGHNSVTKYAFLRNEPAEGRRLVEILRTWTSNHSGEALILCGHRHEVSCGEVRDLSRCRIVAGDCLLDDGVTVRQSWLGRRREDGSIGIETFDMSSPSGAISGHTAP